MSTELILEGAWQPVAAWVAGRELNIAEMRVARLELANNTYRIFDHDASLIDQGRYHLDLNIVPHSVDLEGSIGLNAGRRVLAICAMQADQLMLCYDLDGVERPQTAEPGDKTMLLKMIYARVAPSRLS